PILGDFPFVAQTTMSGDDQRAALFIVLINSSVQNVVERLNLSLNAATTLEIDFRVSSGGKDITGCNHVGAAEMHNGVAVGDCVGLVKNLYRFSVVKLPPAALKERIAR